MEHGHGDEVQKPEGLVAGRDRGVASVADGRHRGHQRVVPSGHVSDQIDLPRVHLEERFNEKYRISPAKHPHDVTFAIVKGDGCVLVRVAIRRKPGESEAGILAGYAMARGGEGEYLIGGVLVALQRRGGMGICLGSE